MVWIYTTIQEIAANVTTKASGVQVGVERLRASGFRMQRWKMYAWSCRKASDTCLQSGMWPCSLHRLKHIRGKEIDKI
jgi:hypothetical protein